MTIYSRDLFSVETQFVFVAVCIASVLAGHRPGTLEAQERFAIIGDFGDTTAANNVASRLTSMKPTWIATVGDNIYTTGGTAAEFDAAIGVKYGPYIKGSASVTGTATTNNFYPSIGNHDIDAGGASLAQNYNTYFNLTSGNDPAISSSSGNPRYFDVVRGDVHLFVLSSDKRDTSALGGGQAIGSPQRTWFNNALAASTSTWNVVAFHHPAYSTESASGDHASNPYMQWGFSSGGQTAQVIFNGHAHTYERTLTPATGQQYVVEGTGGQSTANFSQPPLSGTAVSQFRDTSNPSTINAQGGKSYNGFTLVDANSHYLVDRHYQLNGDLLDNFTLVSPGYALQTASFSNGNSIGYSDAHDTQISLSSPSTSFGNFQTITVDAADAAGLQTQTLMRFDNIIGNGPSRIPLYSEVALATLTIDVTNPGSGLSVHQMFSSWEDNATWNSLLNGVSTDGIEAALAANYDVTVGTANSGESASTNVGLGTFSLDVTKSVQAWANGSFNNGWLLTYLNGGTNGIGYRSSEDLNVSLRPRLDVTYITAVPEPSSLILAGLGITNLLLFLRPLQKERIL